jgi:ParB/RepB/Spo0J family partition protein
MQTSAAEVLKPVAEEIQLIPVDKIDASPFNARKDFPKEYITELAASIARDGQQQAGKVRPMKEGRFQLVYGECRWRGAKLAGVGLYKAVVETMDDAKAERLCLIENVKRKDLTIFEEADKLARLHQVHKVSVSDLAQQIGVSIRTVHETLKLARLEASVRELMTKEGVSVSNAKLISRLGKADQVDVTKRFGHHSHEWLEEYIRENYMVDLRQAPFAVKLEGFACVAVSCAVCPKNARNAKEEYPDLKGADICTAPAEYKKKAELFAKAIVADAKKAGQTVLDGAEAERALRGDGKYIPLDREAWVGEQRKTFKSMVPKVKELKTAIVIDDEDNPIEVVLKTELQEVLKKAGKKAAANSYELTGRYSSPSSGGSSMAAEQKKRRAAVELRRATAALAIEKIAGLKSIGDGDDAFVRVMIASFTAVRDYGETFKYLWRQLHPESKEQFQLGSKIRSHANALKGVELRRFAVRVALAEAMNGGGTYGGGHSQDLVISAQASGVDLAKCAAEAKKAKEAKAPPEEKPVGKKDPLDSPTVAKAKAKKTAAKAKKGGAR